MKRFFHRNIWLIMAGAFILCIAYLAWNIGRVASLRKQEQNRETIRHEYETGDNVYFVLREGGRIQEGYILERGVQWDKNTPEEKHPAYKISYSTADFSSEGYYTIAWIKETLIVGKVEDSESQTRED